MPFLRSTAYSDRKRKREVTDRKLSIVRTIMAVLLNTLVLTACTGSSGPEIRMGWIGTGGVGQMVYEYATFAGTEEGRVRVKAGQTVVLAYAATVDKGTLSIRVRTASNEVLWETTLLEDTDEQQVELVTSEAGTCTILVIGDETGGSFAVSWTVQ
jgi:hypothetical protein